MKYFSKIFFIATFATVAFLCMSVATASASTVFNTNPNDFDTTLVSNYTQNPGCSTCWSPTVSMNQGQVVSVRVYYHNTGNETAQDTRIRLAPQNNPAVNSKIFAGGVWASNANLDLGYATVTIPGIPQTITYIPGTAAWFPDQAVTTPQYLSASQEAALFSSNGVSIGNILADSTCPSSQTFCHQGSVVARFQIGTTPTQTIYACNDHLDNDGDGLIDYPADPGCSSYTDNDEFNTITQQAYVTATTQPATNITQTSATLNGSYATNQSSSTNWFEWGTAQSLGNQTTMQYINASSGTMQAFISGLMPNTTYYFRACADTTATAQTCGTILSFVTTTQIQNAPTVTTISGNCNSTDTSFSMAGSYYANSTSNVTTWFQYGTSYSLGYQVGNQSQYGTSGNFNYTLSGLIPNTTYYFEAVAQNQGGTAYGTILSCTTNSTYVPPVQQQQPPVVTTVSASNIAQTSARINGFLNSTGSSTYTNYQNTQVWFEWGTTYSLGTATQHQTMNTGATFSDFLQNLQPGTRYFYRAMAQNNLGTATGQTYFFDTSDNGVGPKIIYVNTHTGGSGPLLKLTIDSGVGAMCVGDTVNYTVTYQNLTGKTLRDVIVQVILPKEETFLRSSRGSYADAANTVTVLVGDLDSHEQGSFSIEATANTRNATGDTLVSTATAVYTNPMTHDQGDAIAYALINVSCGGNGLAGLAIFGSGSCLFWILILIIIIIALLITRRNYRY